MAGKNNNIGKPSPFSNSAATEMMAVELLESLLDRRFVKGKIPVQDKTPNTDGILIINDEKQFPVTQVGNGRLTQFPNFQIA